MAKRNKTKFASKGRKSALRVESLEQRQLLATITGAGIEVGSNIHHVNGNVYDQVLMTGSSVTVANDPGQITRVSFLDLQGDIVQAEFSGAGTLTVSMDPNGYQTDVAPANYNQAFDFVGPDGTHYTGYVEGLASFTIQGSDASSNIAIFSVGSVNAVNASLFDDTHVGGDHVANVQKLVIVADPANPNGSAFGSIFAGDTIFEGSSGTVGIAANNVQVQGTVTIGNIDASDSGVPTLAFGSSSQFSNVNVTLGNLLSSNGATINDGNGVGAPYGYGINFVDGTDSSGHTTPAQILGTGVNFTNLTHNVTTLDTATDLYIDDGHGNTISQAELNALFMGRTFTKNVTIHGVLEDGFYIDAAAFKGTVTFTNDIAGNILLTNINHTTTPSAVFGGDITFQGNVDSTSHIWAEGFKNVTVDGDFGGVLDSEHSDLYDGLATLGRIGNVTVDGTFSGALLSAWDIGNIWVGGDLTNDGSYCASFVTYGGGGLYVGNIGTVTVVGDVNQSSGFLDIKGAGKFGNVMIEGNGDLGSWDQIGSFYVNSLGAGQKSVGTITVTDAVVSDGGTGIGFGGVRIDTGVGAVGNISITGGNTESNGSSFVLSCDLYAGSFGNITVSGFSNICINGNITAENGAIGNILLSTVGGTADYNNSVSISGNIWADTSIGNVWVDAGSEYSCASLDGNITAGTSIASLFVNSFDINVGCVSVSAGSTLGNVTLYAYGDLCTHGTFYGSDSVGDVSFHAGGNLSAYGEVESTGAVGAVTLYAGSDICVGTDIYGDSIASVTETAGGSINSWSDIGATTVGNVSFTADGDICLGGWIEGDTIGTVTANAGGDFSGHNNILSYTSTGDVSFSAGGSLYFCGTIGGESDASTAIGNVTFYADEGCLTLAGSIGNTYTASLGNVSLTAKGTTWTANDTNYASGGNVDVTCYGVIEATDSIGNVTIDAGSVSGGHIVFDGLLGGAEGGSVAIGNVSLTATGVVYEYDSSTIAYSGDVWFHGQVGNYYTDSVASVTLHAAHNIATGSCSEIYAQTSIGNVEMTADNGSIWLHGNVTSYGTLGDVTLTAGCDIVMHGCANIYAYSSIGNVSFTAANNLSIYGDIYAGYREDGAASTIGNVTFEATNGSLTDCGWLHANTSIGNISFTAGGCLNVSSDIGADYYDSGTEEWVNGTLGNVSLTSTGGDVYFCGDLYGATIGTVSFTADGSNHFSGWVGSDSTSLGDVSFSAGSENCITGSFYAYTAGNFTFDGATTMSSCGYSNIHVQNAGLIEFNDAANLYGSYCDPNIVVGWSGADSAGLLNGLSFNGDTYLHSTVLDTRLANIDGGGDAGGVALHFTNLVASGCNTTLETHTVGNSVFDGNTDLSGMSASFWLANDHTSALDTIGNLTFNGTVTGASGYMDIAASKIGNITITGSLDLDHKNLVTNFNVFAGNNTSWCVGVAGEALSSDTSVFANNGYNTAFASGDQINNFTIGNITVTDTQTFGFSGTALFTGTNTFDSIGGVGNVKLTSGGTVTKEDTLFSDSTGGTLRITAGVFGSVANALGNNYTGGFDFDGMGGIGTVVNPGQNYLPDNLPPILGIDAHFDNSTDVSGSANVSHGGYGSGNPSPGDFVNMYSTNEAVAVGTAVSAELNASFNEDGASVSIGNVEIRAAVEAAGNADTINNAGGLRILSAVTPGDLHNSVLPTRISSNLSGSVGNVFIHNLTQVLDIYNSNGSALPDDTTNAAATPEGVQAWYPGIIGGTSVGTIQTLTVTNFTSGNAVILGNDQVYNYPQGAQPDEIVVLVV